MSSNVLRRAADIIYTAILVHHSRSLGEAFHLMSLWTTLLGSAVPHIYKSDVGDYPSLVRFFSLCYILSGVATSLQLGHMRPYDEILDNVHVL